MYLFVKYSGGWVDPDPFVKYNGSWVQPETIYVRYNGTWRIVWPYVLTPTLTVEGSPSDVPEDPLLEGSAFSIKSNSSDFHESTEWEVVRTSDNVVVWNETEI